MIYISCKNRCVQILITNLIPSIFQLKHFKCLFQSRCNFHIYLLLFNFGLPSDELIKFRKGLPPRWLVVDERREISPKFSPVLSSHFLLVGEKIQNKKATKNGAP